ncbi:hypothetical protein DRB17_19385 [Ferruginivarius sediminum]|uniref:Uncharacterized protein n=2 Tax=Ferruginivarius sediminum TaxID=2661937 RepID=A0A369T7N4_9PROT|nr:hypothetical protein DRB17_19385 [Ferruginivarius sediminum]
MPRSFYRFCECIREYDAVVERIRVVQRGACDEGRLAALDQTAERLARELDDLTTHFRDAMDQSQDHRIAYLAMTFALSNTAGRDRRRRAQPPGTAHARALARDNAGHRVATAHRRAGQPAPGAKPFL